MTDDVFAPVTKPTPRANTVSEELEARELRLRALMLRAMGGNDAAYRELLLDVSGQLRSFYRRRMPSLAAEIEDLVQETLLAIHDQRHTYVEAARSTGMSEAAIKIGVHRGLKALAALIGRQL